MKIPRIPLSQFDIKKNEDPDLKSAYEWLKSYITNEDWNMRKKAIEEHLSTVIRETQAFSESISEGTLHVINKDQIGWYLFLLHTYLFEPHKYEYFQGARVLPIFKRLGVNKDVVSKIGGINKKMRDMFRKRTSEADAILFEILTALLWTKNGWEVSIIPEGKSGKTPDFLVSKGNEKWQVECKRQKTADYTYHEIKKRQVMISQVSELLMQFNILLDITFHVELISLPDTYLKDLLEPIIPITKIYGKIISNKIVDIDLSFVDIKAIQLHLATQYVKNGSPQLLELIASKEVDHSSFTSGFLGGFYLIGEGEANNLYVADIVKAYGVHCYCDAEKALDAKAKNVSKQIFDAIKQFSPENEAIIHIGMETFEGPEVEKLRSEKILRTMTKINPKENKLRWIFYHNFQSYTRSYDDWFFDETVSLGTAFYDRLPPIEKTFLIIPEDEVGIQDASHWEIKLP